MSVERHDQNHEHLVALSLLHALPAQEQGEAEATIAACPACREDVETLRPVLGALVAWPVDVLRPSTELWSRLASRIGAAAEDRTVSPSGAFDWKEAGPGISYNVLATDREQERVSLLVRLSPGAAYPPHTHAGVEELYLLDGELWIDTRKLYPGDYNRAEPGSADARVWSETGCTCVLLTSSADALH
jgi:anti-sigma factor ChrR (cupin superfamily)